MSYNVENLYDIENDSLTMDDDFTPEGSYHWTYTKYKKKLADIAKVITAVGEWDCPALIGLCEIENKKVLWDLVKRSPLEELNYYFIHQDSPDNRGIDVALLYQKDKFRPIHEEFIRIENPEFGNFKTRDILYASGVVPRGDTLHVFVNHWPSRMGGELASEPKRLYVASVLRNKIDSIYNTTANPNVVIMGDFNDTPVNKSIEEVLKALNYSGSATSDQLYNLYYPIQEKGETGSYKTGKEWEVIDQIIISGNLLNKENKFYTTPQHVYIFSADFLRKYDDKQLEFRPYRTHLGRQYAGGISDHFPIYMEFFIK